MTRTKRTKNAPHTSAAAIRVVVVEDDAKVLDGLRWLINDSGDLQCVGAYGRCREALRRLDDDAPDVVLLDIGLPDISGIEGVRYIKQHYPNIHVLMQTVYTSDDALFQSLQAGAVGYLLKRTPSERILAAIRDAYAGGAPMSNEVARRVLAYFQTVGKQQKEVELSDREVEVLRALVEGLTYLAIAEKLFVSINTVRFHLQNIYAKLHVASRSEAIAKALRSRIV